MGGCSCGRVLVDQVQSPERASHAFEKVLEIDPNHGGPLEALAHVRAASGDALAARFITAFPVAYQEDVPPAEAIHDLL